MQLISSYRISLNSSNLCLKYCNMFHFPPRWILKMAHLLENLTGNHSYKCGVDKILRGAGGNCLSVAGHIKCKLSYNKKTIKTVLYVIIGATPLLSRDSSESLGIVALVGNIDSFPQLFNGLGTMPYPYKIKLKDDAKPFSISTPRRISLPLMPLVKNELERLEKMKVIRPIHEPTEWCAPIVPVLKPSGQIRLCVDYKKLNKSMCRELHMLPSVDHTLAQMGEASVFSKLDANSGFHQIKLAPESQPLTKFISPYGRYCYMRLPFRINSAPEHYQKQVQKVLGDQEGIVCLMDNIVVHGKTEKQHDAWLEQVMTKFSKAGITLKKSKCMFKQKEISFLGHMVGLYGIKSDP